MLPTFAFEEITRVLSSMYGAVPFIKVYELSQYSHFHLPKLGTKKIGALQAGHVWSKAFSFFCIVLVEFISAEICRIGL